MFKKLLGNVASALNRHCIPYMVIGGQAVLIYGEPRLTKDIDIALGIGIDGIGKVTGLVNQLGLKVLIKDIDDFVKKTMILPVLDEKTGIRVDLIFSFSAYEKQAIERAKDIKLGKALIRFASLEDVVIHKIVAKRARDIEDVKSILLKNPVYDSHYIQNWLREFDRSLNEEFLSLFNKIEEEMK